MRPEQRAFADGASLLQQMFPQALYVKSAGVRKGELDPFAVAVMAELGQDISGHKPMTFEELEDWEGLNFDLIITLSPEAHHKALELTRTLAADVEYWPTPDPTGLEGNREQKLARLPRSLRRPLHAHPPAVCQGGRGERVGLIVTVASTSQRSFLRTQEPIRRGRRKGHIGSGLRFSQRKRKWLEYLRPRAFDGSRGMGPCVRRGDGESGASTTTCSPVVEWSAFR